MTKSYKSQSCHSIGYKWEIDAPDSLTPEDVEALQKALCDYTDTPDNQSLQEMLLDQCYCETLESDKIELYRRVTVFVDTVHREAFTQSFRLSE